MTQDLLIFSRILVNCLSQVHRSQKYPGDFEIGPWNVREPLIQRAYTVESQIIAAATINFECF